MASYSSSRSSYTLPDTLRGTFAHRNAHRSAGHYCTLSPAANASAITDHSSKHAQQQANDSRLEASESSTLQRYPPYAYFFRSDGSERRPPTASAAPFPLQRMTLPEELLNLATAIAYLDRAGSHKTAQHFRMWLIPLAREPGQVDLVMDLAPTSLVTDELWSRSTRMQRRFLDRRRAERLLTKVMNYAQRNSPSWLHLFMEDFLRWFRGGFGEPRLLDADMEDRAQ